MTPPLKNPGYAPGFARLRRFTFNLGNFISCKFSKNHYIINLKALFPAELTVLTCPRQKLEKKKVEEYLTHFFLLMKTLQRLPLPRNEFQEQQQLSKV